MKKYLALILLSMSALLITSCGNTVKQEVEKEEIVVEEEDTVKQEVGIAPGMVAPDFTLLGRDGEEISLSDYKGKITFLNFWATTCPYCIDEMPDLEAFYNKYKDDGDVALVGVNMTKTWENSLKRV